MKKLSMTIPGQGFEMVGMHANEERQEAARAFAEGLSGLIEGMRLRGLSQRAMVGELNALKIPAASGGEWRLIQLQRVIKLI